MRSTADALPGDNMIPMHVYSSRFCPVRKKSQVTPTVRCGGEGPGSDVVFINTSFNLKRADWETVAFPQVHSIYYIILCCH